MDETGRRLEHSGNPEAVLKYLRERRYSKVIELLLGETYGEITKIVRELGNLPESEKQLDFLTRFSDHYQSARAHFDEYQLLGEGDIMPPAQSTVKEILFEHLRKHPGYIEALRETFLKPILQLEPIFALNEEGGGFSRFIKAYEQRHERQRIVVDVIEVPDHIVKIQHWRIAIIEAADPLHEETNPFAKNKGRRNQVLAWRRKFGEGATPLHLPTRMRYLLLQMDAASHTDEYMKLMHHTHKVDHEKFCPLSEEALFPGQIQTGSAFADSIYFVHREGRYMCKRIRFRPCIVIDMPKK